MLRGLAAFCGCGLRYPLQRLPRLIVKLIWKTIGLLAIGYPRWPSAVMTPTVEETAFACLMGVVLTPLVLPWRYIAHHDFSKPGQRWR